MERHHWAPEVIGRMTFYQAYVALGYKPVPCPDMTDEDVDEAIARLNAIAIAKGH